jgi:hypothetical protein
MLSLARCPRRQGSVKSLDLERVGDLLDATDHGHAPSLGPRRIDLICLERDYPVPQGRRKLRPRTGTNHDPTVVDDEVHRLNGWKRPDGKDNPADRDTRQ